MKKVTSKGVKKMKLTVKKILEICEGTLLCGNDELEIKNYSKDTRTIEKGDCYIGIKGEIFDGNLFWKDAKDKGASACLLDSLEGELEDDDFSIILVEDTVKAIQKLAHYVRQKANIPVVAITGSAGKTSTKDMVASVLSQKYKVLKTPGNLNGQIGLPLNILKYNDEEIMVLEMGMNDLGQIDTLSRIACPNISVITNVGTAHIGILGSRENILKAKLEILNGMNKSGKLIYNGDNDILKTIGNIAQEKITFGLNEENDYFAFDIKMENGHTYFNCQNHDFEIPIIGEVFVYNALAAYAVGKNYGLSDEEIKKGLLEFELSGNRMQIIKTNNYTIINDTYNANLEAMKSAINSLCTYQKRKVAILGDMLELGDYEEAIHQEVGEFLNDKVDLLITIGTRSEKMNEKYNGEKYHFKTKEEAQEKIMPLLRENDTILVKASQGMKLFELVEYLKKKV